MPINKITILALCVGILIFSDAITQKCQAQTDADSVEKQGQSIIRGRVVYADNQRPVRRASVLLYKNLSHAPVRTTPAGNRGQFRFSGMAGGTYFLIAYAPDIISPSERFFVTEFGLDTNDDQERQVVTVDGKNEVQIELRVTRAGTITGTIIYSDKEPVMGGRILLFRKIGDRKVPYYSSVVITNDRGMYRIDGLPAGEYFIGVSERHSGQEQRSPRESTGVTASYYPGVYTFADAKPIQVQQGTKTTDVNFTLPEADVRTVSGTVKWRHNGEPVAAADVVIRRKDEPKVEASFWDLLKNLAPADADTIDTLMRDMAIIMHVAGAATGTSTDQKGRWRFKELTPGTYVVTVYAQLPKNDVPKKQEDDLALEQPPTEPEMMLDPATPLKRQTEVVIGEQDVSGVVIEMALGGRIVGSVLSNGPTRPIVRIRVVQSEAADPIADLPVFSKENGTFVLDALSSGEVRLDVSPNPRDGMYVKSISAAGVDLMRNPVKIVDGGEVGGVQITLAEGVAAVSGRLSKKEGAPAGGAGILLIPADPKLSPLRSLRVFTVADPDGEYSLTCAPGDYIVLTWAAGSRPSQSIQEFATTQMPGTRRITLQPAEHLKLDIVVPSPN